MIYICSVYSLLAKGNGSKARALREKRYQYTAKRVGEMMKADEIGVFSPIVHCHVPANMQGLPKDYSFWQRNDRHMISKSDKVYVLKMPMWESSEGITDELIYAETLGKEIVYLECPDYSESEDEYTLN